MDKIYNNKEVEERIYAMWEKSGYLTPHVDKSKKPYAIILPPPNANAPLHFGHAMFVIEDILIRYHRMAGFSTLWLPGVDHAGFETQYVFEKSLKKEGKSRFDYKRKELYEMIWDHVRNSRGGIENQLRRLGFSLDWSREKFTLDTDIVTIVYKTFKRMYDEGLVYRANRLVNYCPKCATSFSDLEVQYVEQKAPLYYIKYGSFTIATVRPETKFRDTALAVNPKDKRYQSWIGKTLEISGLLGSIQMQVIADEEVNPEFGTGIMKVTPAHDMHDFELGKKYNLPVTPIIDFKGRMDFSWFLNQKNSDEKYKTRAEKYHGKKVAEARSLIVADLQEDGLLEKVDENYTHRIGVCYKCATVLEQLPMEQWFVKVASLAKAAIDVVKEGKMRIYPNRFEKIYYQWLENLHDWNISRQVVWGISIPAWKCASCNEWVVTEGETPTKCTKCHSSELIRDTDTFDTWFSSSQWPFATLMTTRPGDYKHFYPTSVMETGYDILKAWVARMVMMGLYITGKIPFQDVVLHGLVNDPYGKKMSKSKGNGVNPLKLVDQYGADAVRMALVYGTALGNDQVLSYPKLQAMRNFTNKLWNMGRFIEMKKISGIKTKIRSTEELHTLAKHEKDKEIIEKTKQLVQEITKDINTYNFNHAAETLYEFSWHEFADKYIEDVKNRVDEDSYQVILGVYILLLKLLHPFMPFITEEIYQRFVQKDILMIAHWPQ